MNEKIIAVYTICSVLSIGIISINYGIDDTITSVFISDSGYKAKRTTKVYTDVNGNAYIIRYKTKYYLHEFMKTDF